MILNDRRVAEGRRDCSGLYIVTTGAAGETFPAAAGTLVKASHWEETPLAVDLFADDGSFSCRPRSLVAPFGDWAESLTELPEAGRRLGAAIARRRRPGADLVFACVGGLQSLTGGGVGSGIC